MRKKKPQFPVNAEPKYSLAYDLSNAYVEVKTIFNYVNDMLSKQLLTHELAIISRAILHVTAHSKFLGHKSILTNTS